jgi:hypothetical protein
MITGGVDAPREMALGNLAMKRAAQSFSTICFKIANPFGCIGPMPLPGRNHMPLSLAWQ